MIGEFLARLAIALPLVCGAAVVALLAVKRGWIVLPGALRGWPRRPGTAGLAQPVSVPDLAVMAVKSLAPASRVAVVRFHGRDHLVGLNGSAIVLLATAEGEARATVADAPIPLRQEASPWAS